jgi:hypothetical protein
MDSFFENKYLVFCLLFFFIICYFNFFYINNMLQSISMIKSFFYVDFFVFDDECRFFDFEI